MEHIAMSWDMCDCDEINLECNFFYLTQVIKLHEIIIVILALYSNCDNSSHKHFAAVVFTSPSLVFIF